MCTPKHTQYDCNHCSLLSSAHTLYLLQDLRLGCPNSRDPRTNLGHMLTVHIVNVTHAHGVALIAAKQGAVHTHARVACLTKGREGFGVLGACVGGVGEGHAAQCADMRAKISAPPQKHQLLFGEVRAAVRAYVLCTQRTMEACAASNLSGGISQGGWGAVNHTYTHTHTTHTHTHTIIPWSIVDRCGARQLGTGTQCSSGYHSDPSLLSVFLQLVFSQSTFKNSN